MSTRRATLASFALVGLLAPAMLAGCSAAGGDSSTLQVIRGESFDGWNPDRAAAYATYQTLANVLEPLLRSAPSGEAIEAGIASEWTYDADALTWTFTLRDDARFSDGEPITAEDVAFSADVWMGGENYGSLYAGIAGVLTPDEDTVVFQMAAPDTSFPVLMTWTSAAVYPKDFGGLTAEEFFQDPVGAGAFTVERWSTGGEIVLEANEHYYEPVGVDRVVIKTVTDANQSGALIESGQADISEYISAANVDVYGDAIVALPPSQIEHLSFNTLRAPLDDVNIRKAIAYAIDYEALADGAFKGYGVVASGILPSTLANWAPPTVAPYAFDLEAAEAALAEAGTVPSTLEVVYDAANQTDNVVAQILKENLAVIGIDLQLSPLETGAFLDRAYGGDADLVLWSFGAISPDVVDPVGWILGTSWLFSNADTAPLEAQFFEYSAAADGPTKEAVVTRIQDEAIAEMPAAPLSEFQVLYAVGDRVDGFEATPWGMYRWNEISLGERG
jgi:peptide/nickel transport system substrate-binding protein